ncbi:MAG: hypothetical protein V4476_19525 [Pseudomonadota bacterium]
MSDNNNLLLGLGLIVGAAYFARRKPTQYQQVQAPTGARPLGAGSMPGSVGSGVAQQLGGLLGNLLSPKSGGGTQTGAPAASVVVDQYPYMVGDGVLQNSIEAADPMNTFDPGMSQGSLNDWIGSLA